MEIYLHYSQILISVLLVATVLLQVRGMGGGLFGSAQSTFRTRRGLERFLFLFTIILGILFVSVSIISFRMG